MCIRTSLKSWLLGLKILTVDIIRVLVQNYPHKTGLLSTQLCIYWNFRERMLILLGKTFLDKLLFKYIFMLNLTHCLLNHYNYIVHYLSCITKNICIKLFIACYLLFLTWLFIQTAIMSLMLETSPLFPLQMFSICETMSFDPSTIK